MDWHDWKNEKKKFSTKLKFQIEWPLQKSKGNEKNKIFKKIWKSLGYNDLEYTDKSCQNILKLLKHGGKQGKIMKKTLDSNLKMKCNSRSSTGHLKIKYKVLTSQDRQHLMILLEKNIIKLWRMTKLQKNQIRIGTKTQKVKNFQNTVKSRAILSNDGQLNNLHLESLKTGFSIHWNPLQMNEKTMILYFHHLLRTWCSFLHLLQKKL